MARTVAVKPAPAKPAPAPKTPVKAPARKGAAKQAEPAKRSPAVRMLPESELPTSHPLVGKKVTATILEDKNVGRKGRIVKGKVEYGDQSAVRIRGAWYWTSSVVFS